MQIELEGVLITVTISRRNRNSYLRIGSNGHVRLSTPLVRESAIRTLLHQKMEWIHAKRAALEAHSPTLDPSMLLFEGLVQPLSAFPRLHAQILEAPVQTHPLLIERFYIAKAKMLLPQELYGLSQELGLTPSALRIRKLKRQWGNCNAKGCITLNTHLLKLRPELRRYVIAHELCHLRHMNHSRDFYDLLHGFIPEGVMLRKELRQTKL